MTAPEEIAREAAEAFVQAGSQSRYGGDWDWVFLGGEPAFEPETMTDGDVRRAVARLRRLFSACVLAAIERALAAAPVPGGLSEGRLAELREAYEKGKARLESLRAMREIVGPLHGAIGDLLAHVGHLTRALHDCGQDGSAAVWAAGYAAGREAMKRAALHAVASLIADTDLVPLGQNCRPLLEASRLINKS